MTPAFDAVLCDMDGLLVETESIWFAAEHEVMASLGGTWSSEHQEKFVGGPLDRMVTYMLELTGAPVDADEVLDRVLSTMVRMLLAGPVHWMPGAQQLVGRLNELAVPVALVSASLRPMVDAVLGHIGTEHFAVTVSGDDVTAWKPAPAPYLRAAELVGVDPTRCVAFEDSPTGVASAHAAGCSVIAVPSLRPIQPRDRVRVVTSLLDVSADDLSVATRS